VVVVVLVVVVGGGVVVLVVVDVVVVGSAVVVLVVVDVVVVGVTVVVVVVVDVVVVGVPQQLAGINKAVPEVGTVKYIVVVLLSVKFILLGIIASSLPLYTLTITYLHPKLCGIVHVALLAVAV
jgi:hypothetical protein